MWFPSSYIDSYAREITFRHYGGKLAFHKYDDMVTYWRKNKRQGLRRIIQGYLGKMITQVLDKNARNTFVYNAATGEGYGIMGPDGSLSNFSALTSSHRVTTDLIDNVHLGMSHRNVPYASGTSGPSGNILCITSPGVIYDLQREGSTDLASNKWINATLYADATKLVRGEVGMYHHMRFIQTPDAILYNAGAITIQTTITSPVTRGEGAPDPSTSKVDGAYKVGQGITSLKRYVQLDAATDMTQFSVNDIVTIHVARTNQFGVANGVDFRDGKMMHRRIVSIDVTNKRLTFDRPVMENFDTDLGGGVYGYVTKARHVHTMLFLGGTDGVVMGVGQPPRVYTPQTIDDAQAIYRFTWDAYLGHEVFEPQVFEVAFLSAPVRVKGAQQV
jgi:N4-gp56 family major capsid protein